MLRCPRPLALAALAAALPLVAAAGSCAPEDPLRAVPVVSGLSQPLWLAAPAGDPRLFVVEKGGRIRIVEDGAVREPPFLDLRGRVSTVSEQGLLGLAFPADHAESGLFYVYYTDLGGDSVLSRFRVSDADPDRADADSEFVVFGPVSQPFVNHNGGTIAFRDGLLYWGLGDGGSGDDPGDRAQDGGSLLGKILRLDVSGGAAAVATVPPDNPFVGDPEVRDEIWALGLRNPYRFAFDRQTGDLWIGDVGQGAREEIDFEPAGDPGGRNYGWRVHEGSLCHIPDAEDPCEDPADPDRFTFPVHEYAHVAGPCGASVTGGDVYRGVLPGLRGLYFFADYCRDRYWRLDPADGSVTELTADLDPDGALANPTAIAPDGFGELHVVTANGGVFRIASSAPDADGDGVPDALDRCPAVPDRSQADADGDGIGDACECGDATGDGRVDTRDARAIQRCAIGEIPCAPLCDATGEGACDAADARRVQRFAVGALAKADLACAERP